MLAAAADITIRADEQSELVTLEDGERETLKQLAVFLALVSSEPHRFPPTGKMAAAVREGLKVKGPAQPKPKNKRKARQAARQGFAKQRRRSLRETVANFNIARTAYEATQEKLREEQEEQALAFALEPKFKIVGPDGSVILDGIPQSAITPVEPEPASMAEAIESQGLVMPDIKKLILPGKVERALGRE